MARYADHFEIDGLAALLSQVPALHSRSEDIRPALRALRADAAGSGLTELASEPPVPSAPTRESPAK